MDNDRKRADEAQQLKSIVDNFNPIQHREAAKIVAQMNKIAYEEYLNAGFTPEQALFLTKR